MFDSIVVEPELVKVQALVQVLDLLDFITPKVDLADLGEFVEAPYRLNRVVS